MKKSLGLLLSLLPSFYALAQVPKPKHAADLEQRASSLSCSLVLITAGNQYGTGFYVSPDGDIATALHIFGERKIDVLPGNLANVTITGPSDITIKDSNSETPTSYHRDDVVENNFDAWSTDITLLKTKKKVPCWLKTQSDENVRAGQHVLTIGFPGLAFGSLSMYSGIVSGRLKSNFPIGVTPDKKPITSNVILIRVQMPISGGLSGAPLIDDQNRAIGVVTSAGAWSRDLELSVEKERKREGQADPSPADLEAIVGELAEAFHDYSSPGYGDAVPMHYLKKALPVNPQPAPHAH